MYYSFSGNASEANYEQEIITSRLEKVDFLKTSSQSPFVMNGKAMNGLTYFPIDKSYQVTAKVEKITTRQYLSVSSSDGTQQRYLKYARLHFELYGSDHSLLVLKPMFTPGLFLAFADETSGNESYGAGRYLDISGIKGDRLVIDFNLAYNPYCAYEPSFSCPFPPTENILPARIKAGELKYSKTN